MNVLNKIKSKKNPAEPPAETSNILNKIHQIQQKPSSLAQNEQPKQSRLNRNSLTSDQSKSRGLQPSNLKSRKEKPKEEDQKLQKQTEMFSNRDSDFSEESFNHMGSFTKILKIEKQSNLTQPESERVPNLKKIKPINEKVSKKSQPITQAENKNVQSTKINNDLDVVKQYSELLFVKKGYQIGRMSIFEGVLEHKKYERGLNLQIRIKQTEIKKFSCKLELIPNPQSISQIYLRRILEIGDNQYLIGEADIIKAVEKSSTQNARFSTKKS